ncbi:MAG: hypothetical protein C0425_11050 [Chlorobiaceae bacterium]|nr:hypothetical protein [Chlorobiaceae bacterium]
MNKKIAINLWAILLIVTYSLICPTHSNPSISPQELWEQGVNEGKLLKLEKSLKEGFRPVQ